MTTEQLVILLAFIVALACAGEVHLARQRHRNPPPSHPFMEPDEIDALQRAAKAARRAHRSTKPYFTRLHAARHQALRRERGLGT